MHAADSKAGTMPLFIVSVGISHLQALRILLEAKVLTRDSPGRRHDSGGEIAFYGDEMKTAEKKTTVPAVPWKQAS